MGDPKDDATQSQIQIVVPDADLPPAGASKRCPCVVLLDCSGSMEGPPIDELNRGVRTFFDTIRHDTIARSRVEIALIQFSDTAAQVIQDFTLGMDLGEPPPLSASGGTPMGHAVEVATRLLATKKKAYKDAGVPFYRPWIVLITDGAPTDNVTEATRQVHEGVPAKKFVFFAVGVQGADMDTLRNIAPPPSAIPSGHPPEYVFSLDGIDFAKLFVWLSQSIATIVSTKAGGQIELPDTQKGGMRMVAE